MKKQVFSNTEKEWKPSLNKKPKYIDIDINKIIRRSMFAGVVTVAAGGISMYALMGINSFFNKNYFEFRSPLIIQAPIVVHEREVVLTSPITSLEVSKVEAKEEPTPTPKPDYRSLVKQKTVGCIDKHPEIADKLTEAFPNETTAILDLVCRESGYQKEVINKSSGACGLFQAYPCDKLKCDLSDVDCQIAWGKDYITNRYGSVEAALLFHDKKGWY